MNLKKLTYDVYMKRFSFAIAAGFLGMHGMAWGFSLSVNETTYLNGEIPVYTISGAPPNSPIYWSSTINGKSTPEQFANYGQKTDANGYWSSAGSPFNTSAMQGAWTKTAQIGNSSSDAPAKTIRFDVTSRLTSTTPTKLKNMLSVSNWGGIQKSADNDSLLDGSKLVQAFGASNIHVDLSPKYLTKSYPGTSFGGPMTSLAQLAASAPYQALFQQPFQTYLINTYSFANWSWVNWNTAQSPRPPFTQGMASQETQEVEALALQLMQTYKNTGKQFDLTNWEGDYMLHKGESRLNRAGQSDRYSIDD